MKYFFAFFTIILLALFGYYYFYVLRTEYILQSKEILSQDGKDFLFKIIENRKEYFIATNKKIENTKIKSELISTNEFWDPEKCAQMLSATLLPNLYFFDTEFKGDSTTKFVDVIYIFNLEDKTLRTFKNEQHKNIYSAVATGENIQIYYLDEDGNYYKSVLKDFAEKVEFVQTEKIDLEDIVYSELKNPSIDLGVTKYFTIQ